MFNTFCLQKLRFSKGVWGPQNMWFSYQDVLILQWWAMLKHDVQSYPVQQRLKYSRLALCFVLITPAEAGTGPRGKGVACQGFGE